MKDVELTLNRKKTLGSLEQLRQITVIKLQRVGNKMLVLVASKPVYDWYVVRFEKKGYHWVFDSIQNRIEGLGYD